MYKTRKYEMLSFGPNLKECSDPDVVSLVSLHALSTASSGLQEQVSGDVPTRAWAKERIRHPRSRCAAMGQWRESVKLTLTGARETRDGRPQPEMAARYAAHSSSSDSVSILR